MMRSFVFLMIITSLLSCNTATQKDESLRHIGLIEYDSKIDTLSFEVCHVYLIKPYFHHLDVGYAGEKPAMVRKYQTLYKSYNKQENGFITIRFIVNCKGEAGRFRLIQMDENYKLKNFSDELVMQLYEITRSLEEWDVLQIDNKSYEYVRDITFKSYNGEIKDIMP